MEQKKLEADTSKYSEPADRILAAAECIKAQAAGKIIQRRSRGSDQWVGIGDWYFDGLQDGDYRVKPEPVRETRELYVAYSNVGGALDFTTREAALDYLRRMYGECRVDRAFVDYEDGVEVARRVRTAGPR